MTATDTIEEEVPKKRSKAGVLVGLLLALAAAGAGFFIAFSGSLPIGTGDHPAASGEVAEPVKPLASSVFVPLDPLVVTIRSSSKFRLLRFTGQLEVNPDHVDEVEQLKPRIIDVMNTYLNALEARHFEDPIAMMKLRSQMLRRVQIVTGPSRVEDMLIMEFILQ
ncbi:MAG: flagellar basal body-associated FliL family protein [Pseudomonadota bacterium]